MKIIYSLSLFVAFYLVLTGCSKKSDPAASVCHIATSTETYGSWSATRTYTYGSNGKVSTYSSVSTSSTETTTYSYNQQGQLTTFTDTYSPTGSSGTPVTSDVTYDAGGRITLIMSPSNKTVFEYNSSGQMIKESDYHYDAASSSYKLSEYSTYTYPNTSTKNYSIENDYDELGNLTGTTTYEYDTKQIPETAVLNGHPSATNNVTKSVLTSGTTYTDVYTYVYNSNGFPTSINSTETGGPNTTTGIRTFSYTNCK